jgi:hypothetical protein
VRSLQGYNVEVEKQFSLNFEGNKTRIGPLEFQVTEQKIVVATEMPTQGDRWFKGMALDFTFCNDYFKPEHQDEDLTVGVPRKHLLESFDHLLRIIQRYFTCEGWFNKVYKYHIRLLMHFTGKKPLNFPYYLYRSLGKMADRVQTRTKQIEVSLFHFSLIKLLVLEELKKTNTEWESFLASTSFPSEITTPQTKKIPPSSLERQFQQAQRVLKGSREKDQLNKAHKLRQMLLKLLKEKIKVKILSSPLRKLRKSQRYLPTKATKGRVG